MSMVTYGHTSYTLDEFGFLEHPDFWDENFAEGIAPSIGISNLTSDHWRVFEYLRRTLEQSGDVPFFVEACMDLGMRLAEFRALFPTGYMRGACRAAGFSYALIAERNVLQTYENRSSIWTEYTLCPMGFLQTFEAWNERFANLIAAEWQVPCGLTEAHWKVIRFLRARYGESGDIPVVYETCRENNLKLEELRTLFPAGYRRGACRAAGLPFHR